MPTPKEAVERNMNRHLPENPTGEDISNREKLKAYQQELTTSVKNLLFKIATGKFFGNERPNYENLSQGLDLLRSLRVQLSASIDILKEKHLLKTENVILFETVKILLIKLESYIKAALKILIQKREKRAKLVGQAVGFGLLVTSITSLITGFKKSEASKDDNNTNKGQSALIVDENGFSQSVTTDGASASKENNIDLNCAELERLIEQIPEIISLTQNIESLIGEKYLPQYHQYAQQEYQRLCSAYGIENPEPLSEKIDFSSLDLTENIDINTSIINPESGETIAPTSSPEEDGSRGRSTFQVGEADISAIRSMLENVLGREITDNDFNQIPFTLFIEGDQIIISHLYYDIESESYTKTDIATVDQDGSNASSKLSNEKIKFDDEIIKFIIDDLARINGASELGSYYQVNLSIENNSAILQLVENLTAPRTVIQNTNGEDQERDLVAGDQIITLYTETGIQQIILKSGEKITGKVVEKHADGSEKIITLENTPKEYLKTIYLTQSEATDENPLNLEGLTPAEASEQKTKRVIANLLRFKGLEVREGFVTVTVERRVKDDGFIEDRIKVIVTQNGGESLTLVTEGEDLIIVTTDGVVKAKETVEDEEEDDVEIAEEIATLISELTISIEDKTTLTEMVKNGEVIHNQELGLLQRVSDGAYLFATRDTELEAGWAYDIGLIDEGLNSKIHFFAQTGSEIENAHLTATEDQIAAFNEYLDVLEADGVNITDKPVFVVITTDHIEPRTDGSVAYMVTYKGKGDLGVGVDLQEFFNLVRIHIPEEIVTTDDSYFQGMLNIYLIGSYMSIAERTANPTVSSSVKSAIINSDHHLQQPAYDFEKRFFPDGRNQYILGLDNNNIG